MADKPLLRWIEFVALFIALPIGLSLLPNLRPLVLPLLAGFGVACLLVLLCDKSFDKRRLYAADDFSREVLWIALKLIPVAAFLYALTWWLHPDRLFFYPRYRREVWLDLMLKYVTVFVVTQELMFRPFFFHRYEKIFPNERWLLAVNTLVFSLLHIVYWNPIAVLLTLPGGFMFARTYARTKSLPVVWLEHALYGAFLFTVGLGRYFAFPKQ